MSVFNIRRKIDKGGRERYRGGIKAESDQLAWELCCYMSYSKVRCAQIWLIAITITQPADNMRKHADMHYTDQRIYAMAFSTQTWVTYRLCHYRNCFYKLFSIHSVGVRIFRVIMSEGGDRIVHHAETTKASSKIHKQFKYHPCVRASIWYARVSNL